ncbi:glycolipid transfer protein domain-containing protein [Pyronema domesticum]|uniref:Similar to Pleckstrin homology domain-containing family A member 8 acc. no. Q80W71 n=1 Tax=Pyronema omphalodes (strain CBS 100304) TaxID=1076935 RepID=U4L590_PYROM|nr:glycolipid transfer protein domain-containing protein [Pyronema domesticum]CCX11129.1 Similar to Pleckstrin homology domain-containing family A member 8; acc. no. Q80W71 [Pyronema omphalodes CBS 100304]
MATYFDTAKRNFKDVPLDASGKVSTTEYLEAAESAVALFDLLGNKAFVPVQKDMTGNVKKLRDRQLAHPDQSATIQDLVNNELASGSKTASEGLLWLLRAQDFTLQALNKNQASPTEELTQSFTAAYEGTLKKHHNFVVKGIFAVAMKACPYRVDFYKKLGDDQEKVSAQMKEWLAALDKIVGILSVFIAEKNVS